MTRRGNQRSPTAMTTPTLIQATFFDSVIIMSTQETSTAAIKGRNPLTFRWSHQAWLHRTLVKIYNGFFSLVPFGIKYGIGKSLRKNKFPYKLIKTGSTLVQIGAPVDTLKAGRSRGMYFSLFNGPTGKTVIIEPAGQSEEMFTAIAAKQGRSDIVVCRSGAWDEKKNLKIYSDPKHPATNFTEGTVDYDAQRLSEYDVFEVECDTVDNLLRNHGITSVDLLSITTNGAEVQILAGMKETLAHGVQYICLAMHEHLSELPGLMKELGYEEFAFDDRGVTWRKIGSAS